MANVNPLRDRAEDLLRLVVSKDSTIPAPRPFAALTRIPSMFRLADGRSLYPRGVMDGLLVFPGVSSQEFLLMGFRPETRPVIENAAQMRRCAAAGLCRRENRGFSLQSLQVETLEDCGIVFEFVGRKAYFPFIR